MLQVIYFDAAGTLFEPCDPVGETYARLARSFGIKATGPDVSAGFRRAFALAPGLAFGPGHLDADLRRMERDWWRNVVRESFAGLGTFTDFDTYFDALFAHFGAFANWQVYPDAIQTLTQLKRSGYAIGLISNFDFRVYGIIRGLGLGPFFDSVTISSEAGFAKPAREIFFAALDRHGVTPDQAMHIGDSLHLDVAGAQAAGIAAVHLDPSSHVRLEINGRVARVSSLSTIFETTQKIPFP